MQHQTEQESFWHGDFGNEYTLRNRGASIDAANIAMFSRILAGTRDISSVIELGANIGNNLKALRHLLPGARLSAVEINESAVTELRRDGGIDVHHASLLDFQPPARHDLVLIKGVLIHINPDKLPQVYDLVRNCSARYVCFAEYYNPSPVEVSYRGHAGRLFKRDFAGEMLDRHRDLRLLDYGFCYRRDPVFPLDDITWFLMETSGTRTMTGQPDKGA